MDYKINTTHRYHTEKLRTLGWELTVCNSLYPENTVLRSILVDNKPFGRLLYSYLSKYIPMDKINKIIEIGGGYGCLMKDFLDINSALRPTMIDISPFLLEKQRETLKDYKVTFIERNFFDVDEVFLKNYDLVIMNENLGDFPAVVGLKKDMLKLFNPDTTEPFIEKIRALFEKYSLPLPAEDTFNLNIGAIEAIEKLCISGIPYIYAGEHSCEASPPEHLKSLIKFVPKGNPERIPLMGHDEYTIKFSYLKKVGESFGYRVIRGVFADFIHFIFDKRIGHILATQGRHSDEAEIICQFIEDLYRYEYLIFIKADSV